MYGQKTFTIKHEFSGVNRRSLIALLGSSVTVVPGCLSAGGDGTPRPTDNPATPSETPEDTASPTPRPPPRVELGETVTLADGFSLSVSAPTVQNSIIADVDVFLRIVEFDGIQFVVVSVRSSDSIDPYDFALERDGDVQIPPKQRQFVHTVLRECEPTCIAIPFSTGETTDAAVVYKPPDTDVQAAWRLPDDIVQLFDSEASLRLQSAEIVEQNGNLGIRFTIQNDGSRDAGFRAIVSPEEPSDTTDPVAFPVPEGETVTKTETTLNTRDLDPTRAVFTHEIDPRTRAFEIDPNRTPGDSTSPTS